MKDYYKILGIQKSADDDEIKKAYRKLAVKYHPDKNKDDKLLEEKFREVTEAYEILKDPQRRHRYNNPQPDLSNIFQSFGFDFARQQPRRRQVRGQPGADLRIEIELTLHEILQDTKKTIKYKRYEKCDNCVGKGAIGEEITCNVCSGSGYITHSHRNGFLQIQQQAICNHCNGTGLTFKNMCSICAGEGRLLKDITVETNIVAGTSKNDELIIRHYGHCGKNNGIPGHLRIRFSMKTDEFFARSNDNIVCNVPITISQAVLGDDIEVKTLEGKRSIHIQKGTVHGQNIKLNNMGLPNINTRQRGCQIVCFTINIPRDMSAEQIELFNQLRIKGL